MTAKLLRTLLACAGAAIASLVFTAYLLNSWATLLIALLPLCMHGMVLAAEFAVMRAVNRSEPVPKPTFLQILVAWWRECLKATRGFCWEQPFRANVWPDSAEQATSDRRGVVLVHGYACNRGIWNDWLKRLHRLRIPFIAVNLEPPWAPISEHVATIDAAVATLERLTGRAPVMVAHSMGGLAARWWRAAAGHQHRIHHLITLGTPHQGTWLAKLGLGENARQMRRGSAWLKQLNDREAGRAHEHLSCYYGHCDNVVFPATAAMVAGADNHHLDACAHLQMIDRSEPWGELLQRIDEDSRHTTA